MLVRVFLLGLFNFGLVGFDLPEDDPNFGLIKANCSNCHSLKLVAQNRMNRQRWDQTITWMQKKQGLWHLGANRKKILDYLEKNLSPIAHDSMDGLGPRLVNELPEKIY